MELIVSVNLAFSIVGFFFIVRMWREVKTRRDEFGENFNIPRGREVAAQVPMQYQQPQIAMDHMQVANLLASMQQQQQPPAQEQSQGMSEGDLQRLVQAALQAQNGGANELHS